MKKISLMEVKQALRDSRFRDSLPFDFKESLQKYLNNPGCGCNVPLYKKILKECKSQLEAYFPGREIASLEEEVKKMAENHWDVINCEITELEEKLKNLPSGRKQIAISRFEDQITCVINHLDAIW